MQVEFHQGLQLPQRAACTRVVIYDQYHQPIAAAVEQSPGHIWIAHRHDAEWPRVLDLMGITDSVISERVMDGSPAAPQGALVMP